MLCRALARKGEQMDWNDVAWPKDYIARKLAANERLSSLGDGDAADCARELWGLLIEAETLAGEFKNHAEEALDANESIYSAATQLVKTGKGIAKLRRDGRSG
jgi:hypothetical protein